VIVRILFAALVTAGGPVVLADGVPTNPAPAAAKTSPEMRAFLVRDGKPFEAPLFGPEADSVTVARVDEETITLHQLVQALSQSHQGRHVGAAKEHDFKPVLDRLVDLKLCVLEAHDMDLDDLPEVKQTLEEEERSQLVLRARALATKDAKAEPAAVDRIYRDLVREYKVRSLLFGKEKDARAFQKAVQRGQDFEKLGKKAVSEKKAQGTTEAGLAPASTMRPEVQQAIFGAPEKAIRVVKIGNAWSVVQVLATVYPDNPEARKRAEERAVEAAQEQAANKYYADLVAKHARLDQQLLKKLDFEAPKPGFAALAKDKRVLAKLDEGPDFTVADLAHGLEMKFFHGIEAPIKEHRANAAKESTFKTLLRSRLVIQDARRLKIPESDGYRRYMAESRDATLFATYVEKVVMPAVKVSEDEGKVYFAKHKDEFTTPAMYKLESLTFEAAKDAQGALDKLRSGTDLKWLRANAAGQIKEDKRVAQIDGAVLSANTLPKRMRSELANAKVGDYRMSEVEGQYYVVRVISVTPAVEQTYEAARAAIGEKLISENLSKAVKDSAAKVRKGHRVDVYLNRIGY
jgi:hypothetical protein